MVSILELRAALTLRGFLCQATTKPWHAGGCIGDDMKLVDFTLAAVDGLLFVVALIQLWRISWRTPDGKWTRQKVFHCMVFSANFAYCVFFVLNPFATCANWPCWSHVCGFLFLAIPQIIFLSTFLLLLSFWIDLCHQTSDSTDEEEEEEDEDDEEVRAEEEEETDFPLLLAEEADADKGAGQGGDGPSSVATIHSGDERVRGGAATLPWASLFSSLAVPYLPSLNEKKGSSNSEEGQGLAQKERGSRRAGAVSAGSTAGSTEAASAGLSSSTGSTASSNTSYSNGTSSSSARSMAEKLRREEGVQVEEREVEGGAMLSKGGERSRSYGGGEGQGEPGKPVVRSGSLSSAPPGDQRLGGWRRRAGGRSRRGFPRWRRLRVRGRQMIVVKVALFITVLTVIFAGLIWVGFGDNPIDPEILAQMHSDFFAVVTLLSGGGLAFYGLLLFFKMSRVRSARRSSEISKVAWVAVVCLVCFSMRAFIVLAKYLPASLNMSLRDKYGNLLPPFTFLYYFAGESIPSAVVLLILRHMPSRDASFRGGIQRGSHPSLADSSLTDSLLLRHPASTSPSPDHFYFHQHQHNHPYLNQPSFHVSLPLPDPIPPPWAVTVAAAARGGEGEEGADAASGRRREPGGQLV